MFHVCVSSALSGRALPGNSLLGIPISLLPSCVRSFFVRPFVLVLPPFHFRRARSFLCANFPVFAFSEGGRFYEFVLLPLSLFLGLLRFALRFGGPKPSDVKSMVPVGWGNTAPALFSRPDFPGFDTRRVCFLLCFFFVC